ncbi:MAG: large subunit ribosomal protein [Actinomycetota bacterium]|nr:large subunit ribosomal protein [Actinomycetota bacterium]
MPEVKLAAEPRSEFGKGAARRLRRAHQIPAVLYGHGAQPVHLTLPGHATMMALKQSNVLLTLELQDGNTELALPKDIQRNPLRGEIEHVDLLLVRQGEKVTVDVRLHLVGDIVAGGLLTSETTSLSVQVEATAIPEQIEFDLSEFQIGSQIHAGQIPLPAGATLITDPQAMVFAVMAAGTSAEDAEDAEAEAEPVAAG